MQSKLKRGHPLKVAILGNRGIPASYGGFETFAEELSIRLVRRGHGVTVYGRDHFVDRNLRLYKGVDIRVTPCLKHKYLETVTHTAFSVLLSLFKGYDVLLVCNAANSFLCWIPRLAGQKVVLNVDGIERLRKKWGRIGKAFHHLGERLATWVPDCVVTDSRTTEDYYSQEYGFRSEYIPYGAPVERSSSQEIIDRLRLKPREYLLFVSRLEPENNAHLVMEAHTQSGVEFPLVVVGDAPYNQSYIRQLERLSEGRNILLTGAIYGSGYRELLSHSLCYVYGGEVGGTHPGLLEAMGAGCLLLVNDIPENREAVGEAGIIYPFNDVTALSRLMSQICANPEAYRHYSLKAQGWVRAHYDWDRVTRDYERLFYRLVGRV